MVAFVLPPGGQLKAAYQWIAVPDIPVRVCSYDKTRLFAVIRVDKAVGNYIAASRTVSGFPDGSCASVDAYEEQVLYGPEEVWIRAGNLGGGTEYLGTVQQVFVA